MSSSTSSDKVGYVLISLVIAFALAVPIALVGAQPFWRVFTINMFGSIVISLILYTLGLFLISWIASAVVALFASSTVISLFIWLFEDKGFPLLCRDIAYTGLPALTEVLLVERARNDVRPWVLEIGLVRMTAFWSWFVGIRATWGHPILGFWL
jgi:hypothetical protein